MAALVAAPLDPLVGAFTLVNALRPLAPQGGQGRVLLAFCPSHCCEYQEMLALRCEQQLEVSLERGVSLPAHRTWLFSQLAASCMHNTPAQRCMLRSFLDLKDAPTGLHLFTYVCIHASSSCHVCRAPAGPAKAGCGCVSRARALHLHWPSALPAPQPQQVAWPLGMCCCQTRCARS